MRDAHNMIIKQDRSTSTRGNRYFRAQKDKKLNIKYHWNNKQKLKNKTN